MKCGCFSQRETKICFLQFKILMESFSSANCWFNSIHFHKLPWKVSLSWNFASMIVIFFPQQLVQQQAQSTRHKTKRVQGTMRLPGQWMTWSGLSKRLTHTLLVHMWSCLGSTWVFRFSQFHLVYCIYSEGHLVEIFFHFFLFFFWGLCSFWFSDKQLIGQLF